MKETKEAEKGAPRLKHKEAEKEEAKEEAPRARSEPEALDGGGSPVDSGSDSEVSFLPCAARALNTDYEDYCDDGDSDQDQSEDVNSGEFESLEESESGLSDSQEHKLRAPRASLAIPMASGSMSLVSPYHGLQLLLSPSSIMPSSVSVKPSVSPRIVCCSGSLPSAVAAAVAVSNGRPDGERREIRLGLPSNERMANDTLCLLEDCQLSVERVNPQCYFAKIPQLSNLQVWYWRAEDLVRKLLSGHLDIGIVGLDAVREYGQGNEDLIMVHDALDCGHCRLSLAIPKYGIFEKINSVKELAQMPQWTEEEPLRVATGFSYLGPKFMKESGLKHVSFSTGEGTLEAAPAMGKAHVVLDLVSSGTTLRENNLKEIEGGTVLESQAVLVASRKSLVEREGVLDTTREILGRLEAHLKAVGQIMVTATMMGRSAEEVAERVLSQPSLSGLQVTVTMMGRSAEEVAERVLSQPSLSGLQVTATMMGRSAEEVTERVLSQPSLSGLQGPAVSQVFCKRDGEVVADCYAIVICVPERALDSSVEQLKAIGGSGVLASPLTYIFDEETPKWQELLSKLGL